MKETIAGLYELLAWCEANADGLEPWMVEMTFVCFRKEEAAAVVRAIGKGKKQYVGDSLVVERYFAGEPKYGSGVKIRAILERDMVCTRKVVGTRVVPAQPAQPERTEEIVEWEYGGSILALGQETKALPEPAIEGELVEMPF